MLRSILAASVLLCFAISAVPAAEPSFKKITLDDKFRSEGVAIADINKDGKNDVIVGDYWYAAPDWKPNEIRKPRKPNRGGYTEAFAVYEGDFNNDKWADVLVVPFHGKPAKWYENPKGKEGHWKERVAFKGTGNETRIRPDLFADGKPVFLMGVEGKIAWVEVPADANGPWTVHNVSGPEGGRAAHKYAHGLGVGDINGDGRNDVLTFNGWWEQPAEGRKAEGVWKFHKANLSKSCSDMYAIDADGDGRNDVFSTSAHGRGVFFTKQSGDEVKPSFTMTTLDKSVHETHSLNFIDINGDGRKDLVTGRRFFAHGFRASKAGEPSDLVWYDITTEKGKAPKLTMHKIDDQSGVGAQFVTADFNGDKLIDVIVSNRKGVFVFLQEKK